jgi:RimJ/RimL family protein N-acetyltransferase
VDSAPRPARAADVPALHAFFQELQAERCPFFLERSLPFSREDVEDLVDGYAESPRAGIWLVERAGRIVGFLQFAAYSHPQQAHAGNLALSVLAPWRRRGIARALLETLLAWAGGVDGLRRLSLEVFATNAPAIRLYETFGFTRDGAKREAARVGEEYVDILLMSRPVGKLER